MAHVSSPHTPSSRTSRTVEDSRSTMSWLALYPYLEQAVAEANPGKPLPAGDPYRDPSHPKSRVSPQALLTLADNVAYLCAMRHSLQSWVSTVAMPYWEVERYPVLNDYVWADGVTWAVGNRSLLIDVTLQAAPAPYHKADDTYVVGRGHFIYVVTQTEADYVLPALVLGDHDIGFPPEWLAQGQECLARYKASLQ